MSIRSLGVAGLILAGVLCTGPTALYAQGKPQLPWQDGRTLEYNAVNQDLRILLRSIVRADGGFNVIIKPEVKGQVTVQFQNVPVAAAFNQVIEENNLDYTYSAGERTVTVFPRTGREAVERGFVVPAIVNFGAIRRALVTHGLGTDGVSFDSASNTVSIRGEPDRVKDISDLIKQLDAAELQRVKIRQDQEEKRQSIALQNEQAYAARVKADAERKKAEADRRRAEFEQKLYERMLDFKVKVIRLRFASVGATEKKFQDKTFEVPGIEDTLRKILGLATEEQARSQNQQQGNPIAALTSQSGLYVPGAFSPGGYAANNPQVQAAMMAGVLKPLISVDPRTNSVIVRGTEQAIAEVEKIVRQLDQPLRMIEIEVAVIKADSNVIEDLGVAYRAQLATRFNQDNSSRGGAIDTGTTGGQVDQTSSALDAVTLLPTVAAGGIAGSFLVQNTSRFLQIQIDALASKQRLQTISSPRVVTLDNITARVVAATNVFVQIAESGDNGSTFEKIETGLELDILPSIVPSDVAGADSLIRLNLTARNSTPSASQVGGTIDVDSREVQTQVLIPDGSTFVMGGLFDDTRSVTRSGIPFLQDIPLLGTLFRQQNDTNNLNETIFLVTPRIVDDQRLSRDIATRQGTLEYMKRQRDVLHRTSREVEQSSNGFFPDAIRTQEEME